MKTASHSFGMFGQIYGIQSNQLGRDFDPYIACNSTACVVNHESHSMKCSLMCLVVCELTIEIAVWPIAIIPNKQTKIWRHTLMRTVIRKIIRLRHVTELSLECDL